VPCFNQAEYLFDSIRSVIQQSYPNWECIIVDDGSTDDTEAVAHSWCKKDERFRYIHQENSGLSAARNTGIEQAKGDFILPLDADDKIADQYIEKAIEAFEQDPKLKLVYCRAHKFGMEEGAWDLPDFSLFDLAQGNIIFCSSVFRRSDWMAIGGYDPLMRHGLEDWEFHIRLLKDNGAATRLDYVGFYYRIKERSMIADLDDTKDREMKDLISIKHADFFVEQVGNFSALLEKKKRANRRIRKLQTDRWSAIKVLLGRFK
jgi:glycosyltransferase involved in cell wall biosynthesis